MSMIQTFIYLNCYIGTDSRYLWTVHLDDKVTGKNEMSNKFKVYREKSKAYNIFYTE